MKMNKKGIKILRIFLWVGLISSSYFLFYFWNAFQDNKISNNPVLSQQESNNLPQKQQPKKISEDSIVYTNKNNEEPRLNSNSTNQNVDTNNSATNNKTIRIENNDVIIEISVLDGSILKTYLKQYPISQKNKEPIQILKANNDNLYQANFGLIGYSNQINEKQTKLSYTGFTEENSVYKINSSQAVMSLTTQLDGFSYTLEYHLAQNGYRVTIVQKVDNELGNFKGNFYSQIKHTLKSNVTQGLGQIGGYESFVLSTNADKYNKLDLDDLTPKGESYLTDSGWVAFIERYFVTALVPDFFDFSEYYIQARQLNLEKGSVGFISPEFNLKPQELKEFKTTFYSGPKIATNLIEIEEDLALTIDLGWFWFISELLLDIMVFLSAYITNWGFTIIVLTLLIKLVFFPLSNASYKSMAKMKLLNPKIQQLKQIHGGSQEFSKELMSLYKKEKVNPALGCIPMLIQMPVFIALYWMIIEAVELRQANFLWIDDLSQTDSLFIFPILTGISMYLQQKLNPAPNDPMQAKIFQLMPVLFTVFMIWLPAGLTLYFFTNTVLSILQQYVIMRMLDKKSSKGRSLKKAK